MFKVYRNVALSLVALIVAVLVAWPVLAQPRITGGEHDETAALEIHARLNAWRMSVGLVPLARNSTLDELAMGHARYVDSLRNIPDGSAIHINDRGEGVKERARYQTIAWPNYGQPSQIAVGEIASVRNISGSIGFWQSSTPHRRSVTTAYYREVGIAALPHRGDSYIFIVVLGSRPNVLPALLNPDTGKIHLTQDLYPFIGDGEVLSEPDQIKLFDEAGRPMHDDWLPWESEIDVPSGAGDSLYVMYGSSQNEDLRTISEVDLRSGSVAGKVMLPDYVPTATPSPTATLTPTNTWTPTPLISPTPTLTPTATFTPSPTPIPPPELLLIYDEDSFTILNQSRVGVDLFDINFVAQSSSLPAAWWSSVVDDRLLSNYRNGWCVMAYSSVLRFAPPEMPEECRRLIATRGNLNPVDRFWLEGRFFVEDGDGNELATCLTDDGRCEVDIPSLP